VDVLKASIGQTSTSTLQDAATKDVMEISEKCSETATELQKELSKLQLDSKSDLRRVIRKTFQAMRRKSFIEKVQKELKEYQRILDTRILVKLDAHALQQREDFRNLDQNVRDLAVKMNEGRNTFAQLLADNRQAVLDHIDRGFAKHAQLNADIDAQQQFKKSLFFPEILSRQEQISEAHRGTCRWIFSAPNTKLKPPRDSTSDNTSTIREQIDTDNSKTDKDNDSDNDSGINIETDESTRKGLVDGSDESLPPDGGMNTNYRRSQPWSSFVDWLEHGEGIYWVSGKPGSGKTTLMNYITSENRTKEVLEKWADGCDLVMASFYFWKPGTDLQKSFQGLLRSLLYQIADQRDDLIHIMMNGQASLAKGPTESLGSLGMHEWTVKRLLSVLRHFFIQKPSSVRICFFIDGLDEFDGEEDELLEIIHFISQTAQVKICVSSRRLPIFLQAFQDSPQLNQQDFNRADIEKTANDKLRPKLKSSFPSEKEETESMIKDVCNKAQGVFLWLDLTIKALVNAIRNGDTMEELSVRLQTTPDTIEGLYRHMLNRLDKLYLATAAKYFRFLKEARFNVGGPWTLLGFVCVDYPLWQRVLNNDLAYFESSEFFDTCHKIENRILTRCAGLVEINDHPNVPKRMIIYEEETPEQRTHQVEGFVSRHFREVNFIHRSVLDYLETHQQEFFQTPNWRLEARLAHARSQLGEMSVIPIVKSELYEEGGFVRIGTSIIRLMGTLAAVDETEATGTADRALEHAACEMVDQTFQVIQQVHVNLNCSVTPWYEEYFQSDFVGFNRWEHDSLPFHDCQGFAAYFSCRNFVSHYLSLHNCSLEECDYLLTCTVVGLAERLEPNEECNRYYAVIEELVRRGANPNLLMHVRSWEMYDSLCEVSAFGMAFQYLIRNLRDTDRDRRPPGFYISFMKTLLSHGADVNTSVFSDYSANREAELTKSETLLKVGLEESPLSYMERHMTSEGSDPLKETGNLLRSHGALQRRRCRLIGFIDYVENESSEVQLVWSPCYRLSQEQSNRIFESYEWKFESHYRFEPQETRPSTDALTRVATEIRPSLTEADIVDNSTYVLRSSFKSEVGET
jgi:hypothetical protein